jgi:hypothetical protein
MTTIIAARFNTRSELGEAVTELKAAGFAERDIRVFHVTPPGQHPAPPPGGTTTGSDPGHVAVRAPSVNDRERAIEIVSACNAQHVEVVQGTWRAGAWVDGCAQAQSPATLWQRCTVNASAASVLPEHPC